MREKTIDGELVALKTLFLQLAIESAKKTGVDVVGTAKRYEEYALGE
jgi:hypothetical protein